MVALLHQYNGLTGHDRKHCCCSHWCDMFYFFFSRPINAKTVLLCLYLEYIANIMFLSVCLCVWEQGSSCAEDFRIMNTTKSIALINSESLDSWRMKLHDNSDSNITKWVCDVICFDYSYDRNLPLGNHLLFQRFIEWHTLTFSLFLTKVATKAAFIWSSIQ